MMTATCASPIARRICSPVSLRSTRAVGSSSSIRWSAGPILSRSPFDTGSIATWSVGLGEVDRRRDGARHRAVVIVSPVSVTPSLATAPISPASQLGRRLLLLAVEVQQLADALVLAPVGVEHRPLALERPRQDAQVRQPADERVGGGLEHADEQLAAGRRDLDVLARLVGRGVRALLLGRGQVADDRVEQRRQADALGRGRDEDGREDRLADALVEARVELRVARSPPRRGTSRTRRRPPRPPPRAAGPGAGATSSASSSGTGISTSLPPSNRHALRWTRST